MASRVRQYSAATPSIHDIETYSAEAEVVIDYVVFCGGCNAPFLRANLVIASASFSPETFRVIEKAFRTAVKGCSCESGLTGTEDISCVLFWGKMLTFAYFLFYYLSLLWPWQWAFNLLYYKKKKKKKRKTVASIAEETYCIIANKDILNLKSGLLAFNCT